jgi:hypothetical protein
MATNNNDRKISQLPTAEPLTGSELIPIVQNGQNKRITVSDIASVAGFISSASELIVRETPSGLIDGINKVFTLSNTPALNSEQVFLNGILQEANPAGDYTITADEITFNRAPDSGWTLFVNYLNGDAGSGAGSATLDALTDVVISSPTANQILKFDGAKWINSDNSGGSVAAFQWSSSEQVYPFERASNGSILYCKEIDMGFLTNKGGKTLPHAIDNYSPHKIHSITGMIYNTVGGDAVAINSMAYGGNYCILDGSNISVYTPQADWTTYKCNVRLIYFK